MKGIIISRKVLTQWNISVLKLITSRETTSRKSQ